MANAIKLLMIDNYDSFTYNIVQYLGELGAEVTVARNDEITIAQIDAMLLRESPHLPWAATLVLVTAVVTDETIFITTRFAGRSRSNWAVCASAVP